MKSQTLLAALLLAISCGPATPGSEPPKREIVVPPQSDVADQEVASEDAPASARQSPGSDIDSCTRNLRDGERIPPGDPGEATYKEALAAERASDFTTARKTYFQLIQTAPRSAYVPLTYLAFGELFFNDAKTDPSKWDLAGQAYKEVVKYPPPDNTAYAYTWLRLGDIARAKGDNPDALNAFKKAIEAGAQYPNLPCVQSIGLEARTKLTETYQEVGDPKKAHLFFRNVAGDGPALEMLADLVERYREKSQFSEACVAARARPATATGASATRLTDLERQVCKKP